MTRNERDEEAAMAQVQVQYEQPVMVYVPEPDDVVLEVGDAGPMAERNPEEWVAEHAAEAYPDAVYFFADEGGA